MHWSNFDKLGAFFETGREFDRIRRELSRLSAGSKLDFPAVNLWVSPDKAVVTTEIPGIDIKTLDISVAGNYLILRGKRDNEQISDGESYHRKERWSGSFGKTLELPYTVEADKVDARYSKGVLSVSLPRAEAEKPRKIEVATN